MGSVKKKATTKNTEKILKDETNRAEIGLKDSAHLVWSSSSKAAEAKSSP